MFFVDDIFILFCAVGGLAGLAGTTAALASQPPSRTNNNTQYVRNTYVQNNYYLTIEDKRNHMLNHIDGMSNKQLRDVCKRANIHYPRNGGKRVLRKLLLTAA